MKAFAVIVSLLGLMIVQAQAQEEEQGNPIRRGQALAARFCGQCHAIGATGRRSPRPDAPPLRTIGRTYDLDTFARVLSAGLMPTHPDMPQFKFKIEDARALRDYLRTIQE
jgi:mono/diheme cytochrome c family protein